MLNKNSPKIHFSVSSCFVSLPFNTSLIHEILSEDFPNNFSVFGAFLQTYDTTEEEKTPRVFPFSDLQLPCTSSPCEFTESTKPRGVSSFLFSDFRIELCKANAHVVMVRAFSGGKFKGY